MEMEQERERPLAGQQRERERQQELQLLRKKNYELSLQTKKLEEKVRSLEKVQIGRHDLSNRSTAGPGVFDDQLKPRGRVLLGYVA